MSIRETNQPIKIKDIARIAGVGESRAKAIFSEVRDFMGYEAYPSLRIDDLEAWQTWRNTTSRNERKRMREQWKAQHKKKGFLDNSSEA